MTHLREVLRLPVSGDKLVVRGRYGYLGSLHSKAPHALSVLDLSEPAKAHVIGSLPFERQIQAMALVGDVLYVSEYRRAVHLVPVDRPTQPAAVDCHLMFRQEIYELAHVGSRWLVAARNWQGVSVFDVSDPLHPRQTDERKLGESFVEAVRVVGDRIFATAHKDGLVELRVDDNGKLHEVARYFGGEHGFSVHHACVVGDRLWLFGEGALDAAAEDDDAEDDEDEDNDDDGGNDDEPYEEPEEDPNCVVLSLADLTQRLWAGASPARPKQMTALRDGGAIAFEGYRCFQFPAAGKPVLLFMRYETDAEDDHPDEAPRYFEIAGGTGDYERPEQPVSICSDACAWARLDNYLLVTQPSDLVIYEIAPDSPLAKMAGGDVLTSRR